MKKVPEKKPSKFNLVSGSDWLLFADIIKEEGQFDIYMETDYHQFMRERDGIFVNDAFMELWNKTNGLMFLDGGYGSSKTTYAITRQLVKCMENKYHKCFYGRQKKTEARELHKNIIREIKRNRWEDLFDYSEKPTGSPQITCIESGNSFELFGCDDVDSLKGIDNPTDILIDEINQISFESFGMLLTRLRTPGCELQLIGCFNNCDVFPDHWLVRYIYGDEEPTDNAGIILKKALRKKNIVRHHSVYTDNKTMNHEEYLASLEIKANGDPEKIRAYCDGTWGVRLDSQPYYKQFKTSRDISDDLEYDPSLPIHFGFDENVNPYLPALMVQIVNKEIRIFDEVAAKTPYNSLDWVCLNTVERYKDHETGMYIYGDATSKKEDVKVEKGGNFYTLAMEGLRYFRPSLRVPESNPNNRIRQQFMNAILKYNIFDLKIIVSSKCKHMIEDFVSCMEAPDGNGKDKSKVMVNGIRGVQRYGHFGDIIEYIICYAFRNDFILFQTGGFKHAVKSGIRQPTANSLDGAEKRVIKTGIEKVDLLVEKEIEKKSIRRLRKFSKNAMT